MDGSSADSFSTSFCEGVDASARALATADGSESLSGFVSVPLAFTYRAGTRRSALGYTYCHGMSGSPPEGVSPGSPYVICKSVAFSSPLMVAYWICQRSCPSYIIGWNSWLRNPIV